MELVKGCPHPVIALRQTAPKGHWYHFVIHILCTCMYQHGVRIQFIYFVHTSMMNVWGNVCTPSALL